MGIVLDKNDKNAIYRKKSSILRIIFSPFIIVLFFVIIEIFIILNFKEAIDKVGIDIVLEIFNFFSILYLVNSKKNKNEYKITWMIVFILLPGFGVLFYLFLRFIDIFNKGKKKLRDIVNLSKKYYSCSLNEYIRDFIREEKSFFAYSNKDIINENLLNEFSFFNYFDKHAMFPTYSNTDLVYFNNGKEAFEDILMKLKNAKKFIFIEIFILSDGIIWRNILEILKEKVNEGVEVRLMFDGLNSLSSFSRKYAKQLKNIGINAKVFKPISPVLAATQNQRDHRKLFIIDNEIAYTGGINIADEYANLYERFGVWKDAAIRVTGSAVESFTIMFLQVWFMDEESNIYEFKKYLPKYDRKLGTADPYALITPYTDYPSLSENISLQIFKYMCNSASKYMYIMTPYLVIDEGMADSLESAAKRGVDVRIIVPHIPDKKYVYFVNNSYYKTLTLAGVRVYEYLPGFIHSKCYLQDDMRAIVGTANLDFRSMFLHYENGVYYFAEKDAILDLKNDFLTTFNDCKEMTLEVLSKMPWYYRVFGSILRIFAPLM